jgi:hypothetical protein
MPRWWLLLPRAVVITILGKLHSNLPGIGRGYKRCCDGVGSLAQGVNVKVIPARGRYRAQVSGQPANKRQAEPIAGARKCERVANMDGS